MNDLEIFKKIINLNLTDTIKREESARIGFNLQNYEVNYDNTVSLWNLINIFNEVYLKYKEDYLKLDKMGFKELGYFNFYKNELSRVLRFVPLNQKIHNYFEPDIFLIEKKEKEKKIYKSYIESEFKNYLMPGYFLKKITLDNEKVKNMIDFFEKYNCLFKVFNSLYANPSHIIFNYIGRLDCQDIDDIKLCFGDNAYYYYFVLDVILGDKLDVNEKESYVSRNNIKYNINKENIEDLLNNFYVNKKFFDGIDELEELSKILNTNKSKVKKIKE